MLWFSRHSRRRDHTRCEHQEAGIMEAILLAACGTSPFCEGLACVISCFFCIVFFKKSDWWELCILEIVFYHYWVQTYSLTMKAAFHAGIFSQMKVVNFNVVYFNQFSWITNTFMLKYLSYPEWQRSFLFLLPLRSPVVLNFIFYNHHGLFFYTWTQLEVSTVWF